MSDPFTHSNIFSGYFWEFPGGLSSAHSVFTFCLSQTPEPHKGAAPSFQCLPCLLLGPQASKAAVLSYTPTACWGPLKLGGPPLTLLHVLLPPGEVATH